MLSSTQYYDPLRVTEFQVPFFVHPDNFIENNNVKIKKKKMKKIALWKFIFPVFLIGIYIM